MQMSVVIHGRKLISFALLCYVVLVECLVPVPTCTHIDPTFATHFETITGGFICEVDLATSSCIVISI